MKKDIEKLIQSVYDEAFKKVFTKDRVAQLMKGNRKSIRTACMKLQNMKEYKDLCREISQKLASRGLANERGAWKKFYNAARLKHYFILEPTYKEFELKMMRNAIRRNFKMIRSIPEQLIKLTEHKYIDVLIDQVAKGAIGRGTFYAELKQHGVKNAKVIARTETAKLQTAITQDRATHLGSTAYIWRSSHDRRTRPSHRAMNDVLVFWRNNDEQKPKLDDMFGNAGEFPNCRCSPHPVFDEDDLTASTYKVYDYRSHSIVAMSRQAVLQALKRGAIA